MTNGVHNNFEIPLNNDDDTYNQVYLRRNALKKYGKESRHNVISRKDNLVLSPDKPHQIQEDFAEVMLPPLVTILHYKLHVEFHSFTYFVV